MAVVSSPWTKHYYRQIGAPSNSGDQHQTWLIRNDQGTQLFYCFILPFRTNKKHPKPPPSTCSSHTSWCHSMQVRDWESASKRKLLSWYAMAKWSPQKRRPGPADGLSRYHQIINLSPIPTNPYCDPFKNQWQHLWGELCVFGVLPLSLSRQKGLLCSFFGTSRALKLILSCHRDKVVAINQIS